MNEEKKIIDNPPAFPTFKIETSDGDWIHSTGGATLRDYFAGKAMQAMVQAVMASPLDMTNYNHVQAALRISEASYSFADAMLAQRMKGKV